MTDRHSGYVVTLDHDIREDDAEPILTALRQVRGVLSVEPVVGGVDVMIAEQRARVDIHNRFLDMLRDFLKGVPHKTTGQEEA